MGEGGRMKRERERERGGERECRERERERMSRKREGNIRITFFFSKNWHHIHTDYIKYTSE